MENFSDMFDGEDLPKLIGPLKTDNGLNFPELPHRLDVDGLGFESVGEFYVDYSGFLSLLELCDYDIDRYLTIEQQHQISELLSYCITERKLTIAIVLIKAKADWLIKYYSGIEDYEMAGEVLNEKKYFTDLINNFNESHKSDFGKLPLKQ